MGMECWDDVGKCKARKDKVVENNGCWIKLRFIGSCISSRSKVDSSISRINARCESKLTNDTSIGQAIAPVISSTTTSNAESSSSTSKLEEELKVSSLLRKFSYNDLKLATRNFRPESLLGEGGFGCVFKGWIEENGTGPVKPGTGLTVAVKTLNHDGLQGHKEWLAEVSFLGDLMLESRRQLGRWPRRVQYFRRMGLAHYWFTVAASGPRWAGLTAGFY